MLNKDYDIMVCNDDIMELPVTLVNTIEEAANFIGCTPRALYKNMQLCGVMKANGYKVELIKREV